MKIFAIAGLVLVASALANGLALKGLNAPARLSSQQQEQLSPAGLEDLQQQEEQPTPYAFSYDTQSEGSQSSRSESGDAAGRVIGQYSIKGADGISRIVSYTADSEGFRANITTNEPGTETSNPSFIVLQSSQAPAAEISRQLQTEADLAQQEEQPAEELAELPSKTLSAPPRKAAPAKTVASRRPAQLPQPQAPRQTVQSAQVNVVTKSRRPTQQTQTISAPAKRPALAPSKGQAIRARGPTKNLPTSTTPRPRPVQAAPLKRPAQLAQEQTEEEAPAQLALAADQTEDAVADEDAQF